MATTKPQLFVIITCLGGIIFAGYLWWTRTRHSRVDYPYWCQQCKAVFDVGELKRSPKNWQTPPGAPNDSIAICLRCKKGWAYPAAQCYQCGAVHIMHLWQSSECPQCHPDIAKAAAAQGIELMPPELR